RDVVTARQRISEEVRAERAQHERREQRHVVAEERLVRERDQRRRDRRKTEKVLRERERARGRMEDRRIPPVRRQRHGLRGPPHDPRVQQRIAEVVRYAVQEPDRKRPGVRERQQQIRGCRQENGTARHVVRTTLPMLRRFWMKRWASAARSRGNVFATIGVSRPARSSVISMSMSGWS